MKHTDATQATNGYQSYAEPNGQQQQQEEGGNLLALICGSLCKDTPLATMFGPPPNENNFNNNTAAQPLMTPIQNGEHLQDASILDMPSRSVQNCSLYRYETLYSFTAFVRYFAFVFENCFHANFISICQVHPLMSAFQFASVLFFSQSFSVRESGLL